MNSFVRWGVMPVGLWLGFSLERMGFASFDEVHAMFTLQSWRLYAAFGGAMVLLMIPMAWLSKRYALSPRGMQRGTVSGAALFGLGWALTGACPAVAMVQLGTGAWPAVATSLGVLLGTYLFKPVNRALIGAPNDGCAS